MLQKKGKVEEYHLLIRMPQIRVGKFTVSLVFSPFFTGKLRTLRRCAKVFFNKF